MLTGDSFRLSTGCITCAMDFLEWAFVRLLLAIMRWVMIDYDRREVACMTYNTSVIIMTRIWGCTLNVTGPAVWSVMSIYDTHDGWFRVSRIHANKPWSYPMVPHVYACFYTVATSLRQPHPPTASSLSLFIPDASQIFITTSLTALTSSTLAPPLSAPRKWPLS